MAERHQAGHRRQGGGVGEQRRQDDAEDGRRPAPAGHGEARQQGHPEAGEDGHGGGAEVEARVDRAEAAGPEGLAGVPEEVVGGHDDLSTERGFVDGDALEVDGHRYEGGRHQDEGREAPQQRQPVGRCRPAQTVGTAP